MTFINPIALWALPAALIPLLIHLFSRQRFREINFSSLIFLKKLERSRLRNLKVTELILLLMRTLMVLCLILAFSRPTLLKSGGFFQGGAKVSAVFMVDNSLASQAFSKSGSLIAQEQKYATQVLKLFSAGDEIAIIGMGKPFKAPKNFLPADDERLRRLIYELEPGDGGRDWESALSSAFDLLKKSHLANKELYIFSPFYGSLNPADSIIENGLPEDVRLFKILVGPEKIPNLAITGIKSESQMLVAGNPLLISLEVANFADQPQDNVLLNLFLNQERVSSEELSLPANGKILSKLTLTPDKSGFLNIRARLEIEDPLLIDNSAFFGLNIPANIDVALIGSEEEVKFVQLALHPGKDLALALNPIVLKSVSQLREHPQDKTIFLLGVEKISSFEANLIKEILAEGGGVIITPSEITDISVLNRELLQGLECPQYGEMVSAAEASWGLVDYKHPVFSAIFEDKSHLESPVFRHFFRLKSESGYRIITFRDGNPFMLDLNYKRGKIVLLSSAFSDFWGNFHNCGIFPPLMHRIALYLGANAENKIISGIAGEPLEIALDSEPGEFTLLKPDGQRFEILPNPDKFGMKFKFLDTERAGIYCLLNADTASIYAINPASENSALARTSHIKSGIDIEINAQTDLNKTVEVKRLGMEIWKWFLCGGIILVFSELIIVRLIK